MCVPYAVLIVQCQRLAHAPHVNDKSRLVWEQLPVLPQMVLAASSGLGPLFDWLPYGVAYAWLATQAFVMLYLFGWALDEFFRARGRSGQGASAGQDAATRDEDRR